jgi:hypothetical protein
MARGVEDAALKGRRYTALKAHCPRSVIPTKILVFAVCAMACAWIEAPVALGQGRVRPGGGGHVGGAVVAPPPVSAPPVSQPMILRPRGLAGPGVRGIGVPVRVPRFGVRPGPIRGFRRPPLVGALFFRFGMVPGFLFNLYWWQGCGPVWGWPSWQFGCSGVWPYPSGFENYVTMPNYENPAYVYEYGLEVREPLVWLYLKDGTVYAVSDYWFVNGQLHFKAVGEGGVPSAEQVIGADELDLQRTSDVNTARGFRVVVRDKPWQQYLKDYPDRTPPPLVAPPQKN